MTRINTNIASLRSLSNVQKSQSQLNQSLERLSTGLQINSGKDNPAGLIQAQSLGLQITTINQSIDNANQANNVLSTADSSLGEIGGLLNQIRGLVQQSLNSGALSSDQIQANQQQIDQALTAINQISANTTFGGKKLIDGSQAFTTTTTAADAAKLNYVQINQASFGTSSQITLNTTVTAAAKQGQLVYNGGTLSSATTLEVAGSNGSQVVFLGANSTAQNINDAINSVSDVTGVDATLQAGLTVGTASAATAATKTFTAGSDSVKVTANTAGAAGNSIAVKFVAGSGNNVATSAAEASGVITVTLGTDGTGAVDSTKNTADKIAQAINGISGVDVTATSTGTTTGFTAASQVSLAGGADAVGAVKFLDARAPGSTGTISVKFVDPGSNSAALSVATSAADSQGNRTITVSLATDGSGNITSTSDQIASAIANDATASTLVQAKATGTGVVAAASQANLSTTGADAGVVLTSHGYGSSQFAQVNVLSGSFATTLSDGTTASYRSVGSDIQVNINGQAAQGDGLTASISNGSLNAALTFNAANNVANTTAAVTITGGGALFQIGQQADSSGQINLGIQAVNTARLGGIDGKLYELGSGGGKSLTDIGSNNVSGQNLADIVTEALNQVNTLRGQIGAVQKDVIDTNVSTLGVALQNITDAQSQIQDTDFAAETANLQKAQVLSQAGISVLTIANQVPQQVLALLRG